MQLRRLALAVPAAGLTLLPSALGAGSPQVAFTELDSQQRADVVLLGPEGTGLVDLTPGQQNPYDDDRSPAWSPDGSKLAFVSHRDGPSEQEIYVMNADGTGARKLTSDSGTGAVFNVDPTWSPDARRIAWRKAGRNSTDEIWVMNADGSGQRRLTADAGDKTAPEWSPDSSRLLYARRGPASQVFVVEAAGGAPRLLTPAGAADSTPSWSPDGTRIALDRNDKIWVVDADGTDPRQISPTTGLAPAWSPDGTKIAFTGIRTFPQLGSRFGIPSRNDIFVAAANGSTERRLTGPVADDVPAGPSFGAPSWWPDGSRLFFSPGGTTWTMNADGTCEGPFTAAADRLVEPAWKPGAPFTPPRIACVDLRIAIAGSTDAVGLKQAVVFHVQIDNDGSLTATNVRARLDAPSSVTLAPSVTTCTRSGGLVCRLGSIPPGLSASFELYASSPRAGAFDVDLTVSADQDESDASNNSTRASATVLPCTTVGTLGNDAINGTQKRDLICARAGWDRIDALAGNDVIDAGSGNDTVDAGAGRDSVVASSGADVILTRDGQRDRIDCGAGHDVVLADRFDQVARNCEEVVRR